jgi:phosphoenolpyruvate-protein phosphotransferase
MAEMEGPAKHPLPRESIDGRLARTGVAVSPGIAIGTARCLHECAMGPEAPPPDDQAVPPKLARYDRARILVAAELAVLHHQLAEQSGLDKAAIYHGRLALLRDPVFTAQLRAWIVEGGHAAEEAFARLLRESCGPTAQMDDENFKCRLDDVRDVIRRIDARLADVSAALPAAGGGPPVLVAGELTPAPVMSLGSHPFAAVVTQAGGRTSRAMLLARSRGIPAVAGVSGILAEVTDGDTMIVDGCAGRVVVNPDDATRRAYRALELRFTRLKEELAANSDLPAISADGESVELLANVNSPSDVAGAVATGAAGIGLMRSEYFFLNRSGLPDEEEQVQVYREAIATGPPGPVTIRTWDLTSDRAAPQLGNHREANPFMGWRSIRLSFEHPEPFLGQLRAILRAAAAEPKPVRIMFPMITALEELRRVRTLVRKARRQLAAEGVDCPDVPLGPMVEVPAAAISIRALAKAADFISIGSNDLIQYLTAADRDNPRVSHLCQPYSPAVLQVLAQLIAACRRAQKPVTLCGEMAGAPRAVMLLFGMGLRSFSTGPAFIPAVRALIRRLTVARAERAFEEALALGTSGRIIRHMTREIEDLCPDLTLFESV